MINLGGFPKTSERLGRGSEGSSLQASALEGVLNGSRSLRAAAIHQCNLLAARYPLHDWGNTQIYLYRSCIARYGQQE